MAGDGLPALVRLLVAFLCIEASFHVAAPSPQTDASNLLAFKASITDANGSLGTWGQTPVPCVNGKTQWKGIRCDGGNVSKLVLEDMNLSGALSLDPLAALPVLRSLSIANNSFEGPIPGLRSLVVLKSVFLSGNKLSGKIPDDEFAASQGLATVHLDQNEFSGTIPTSLLQLPNLVNLTLQENDFDGPIPDFPQPLQQLNVSDNDLHGPIPARLQRLGASSFAGNKDLCGPPLQNQCPPTSTDQSPSDAYSKPKKLSPPVLAAIIIVSIAIALALMGGLFVMLRRRRRDKPLPRTAPPGTTNLNPYRVTSSEAEYVEYRPPPEASFSMSEKVMAAMKDHELIFVREGRERFELQDLLRASAEVLGSGNFGSSYKVVLKNGATMVVKRFKDMNALTQENFAKHMTRLGRLSHPNLLPLVGYHYREEEKLLVFDHVPNGSLAHALHGRGPNHPKLDWPARLKVVKGVARGLAYLYNGLPALPLPPHGHLKSSNVLLGEANEPLLCDYALVPAMDPARARRIMVAYKAPEAVRCGRATDKADVWSLGILILEILTGKLPTNYLREGNEGTDLASWVNSVVREEWTGEVFDSGMGGTRHGEGEMLKLLQIGLGCCEADTGKRWELMEAVEKIQELKGREAEEDYSSYVSEGEYTSRAVTDDDFSFTTNN